MTFVKLTKTDDSQERSGAPAEGLTVDMLPARQGDGLWVEWGPSNNRYRMIIDGGTKKAVSHIRERIANLPEDDRDFELLVISHIDLDHIDAPTELLRTPAKGVTFKDVWFNDYRHLDPDLDSAATGQTRGGKQGEFLGALLDHRKKTWQQPWNEHFGGEAVVVETDTKHLPTISLAGGMRLTLLSPTPPKLKALVKDWEKALKETAFTAGDRALAFELYEQKMGPVTRGGGAFDGWGNDGSAANGSSIAFIADYENQRWLFAADAHEDVLRDGLVRYAKDARIEGRIKLDGFKISHHGSKNNISPDLLGLIECPKYLISTNGSYHAHPDKECIEEIIRSSPDTKPHLAFNYLTKFTRLWANDDRVVATYDFGKDHNPLSEDPTTRGAGSGGDEREARRAGADDEPADKSKAKHEELAVRIFHGSFERANRPVMLGHYKGTTLNGAEGFVDRRFEGRLSERLLAGGYPGDIGTHLHVKAPRGCHPLGGVIVVGLGEYGELTPLLLAETVRAAVVDHALDNHHDNDEPTIEGDLAKGANALSISSVLIGATGDRGIGIRASGRAIVKGVTDANRSLREKFKGVDVRYARLQFWENRAPSAELALLSLHSGNEDLDADANRFDPNALPPGVVLERELIDSYGGLSLSAPTDDEERTWRRVSVTADAEAAGGAESYLNLRFLSDSRRAGVGNSAHPVERRRLRRMLASAATTTKPSSSLYSTLYELLLPNELKWELQSAADIKLVVDSQTADIPWEMLSAENPKDDERQALSLRAPFTRQLQGGRVGRIERASEARALVIGNPPAGDRWPTLPGAYDEAIAVVDTLEQSPGVFEVHPHIYEPSAGADGEATSEVEASFFEEDYRIIHIAGHGAYDETDPTSTGIVIGDNVFITAKFIGQLRRIPDLVFLNCCHLGQVDSAPVGHYDGKNAAEGNFSQLGASLAMQLIRSGVQAVVAAGWAVDDEAAKAFATTFYEQMVSNGAPFGEAVFAARQAAFRESPSSSTWGAYQCYGDSELRLADARQRSVPQLPVTVHEMLRRSEELLERMASSGVASLKNGDRADADAELRALTLAFNSNGWLLRKDGGFAAQQLGRIHAELNEFEPAIDWYDRAVEHPAGAATLGAIRDRAVLKNRYARWLMTNTEDSSVAKTLAVNVLDEVEKDIDFLVAIQNSEEHWALSADHQKRRATIVDGFAHEAALQRALDDYLDAWTRLQQLKEQGFFNAWADPEPHTYALAKYLQLRAASGRLETKPDPEGHAQLMRDLKVFTRVVERWPTSHGGYQHTVCKAECRLAKEMVDGTLPQPQHVKEITELYLEASMSRSTAPERFATIEHLQDLAFLHTDPDQRDALHSIIKTLAAEYEIDSFG